MKTLLILFFIAASISTSNSIEPSNYWVGSCSCGGVDSFDPKKPGDKERAQNECREKQKKDYPTKDCECSKVKTANYLPAC